MLFPFRRRPAPMPLITRIHLTDNVYANVPTHPDNDGRVLGIEGVNGPLDLAAFRKLLTQTPV